MTLVHFHLKARVSSANLPGIRPILEGALPGTSLREEGDEFVLESEVEGSTATELNRSLLSALRRVEKKTRLRSEWTAEDGATERFFDYVRKTSRKQ